MPKKLNSALLRIMALLLLCSIALTGCLGTEGPFPGQSDMNGEYLTPDAPRDFVPENTQSQTTTTAHEHTFSDATCTLPKTCSVCGASEGEPLTQLEQSYLYYPGHLQCLWRSGRHCKRTFLETGYL